jgi:polysaccharide biosynthesis/export protein
MRTELRNDLFGPFSLFLAAVLWLLPCMPAAAEDYRIGAGDLVKIAVFGSPDLGTEARVSQSGSLTVPLIGPVQVAGLSTAEVESLLSRRFVEGNFLRQAQVSVLVTEYDSQKIAVLGHVVKPGQYPLRASTTVLDVLAEAGGVLAQSAADQAVLTRTDGSTKKIDLDALFRGDPAQNSPVKGGDRIYVPRADQFYVYGEVQKPGVYRLERNMTVSRAISAGGGLTARGSEKRAIVKRKDSNGKEQEYTARSTDTLQADDVLLIKESLF